MKNKPALFFLIIVITFQVGFSQVQIQEKRTNTINNQEFLWIQNIENSRVSKTFTASSSVFINQLGDNNTIDVKSQSEISNVNLFQSGYQNNIYLDVIAENIDESITQVGNNNTVIDFSTYGVDQHQLDISQTGNNQNLTWFGGNSIAENMKVTMQGESKTVIVRNFN